MFTIQYEPSLPYCKLSFKGICLDISSSCRKPSSTSSPQSLSPPPPPKDPNYPTSRMMVSDAASPKQVPALNPSVSVTNICPFCPTTLQWLPDALDVKLKLLYYTPCILYYHLPTFPASYCSTLPHTFCV